MTPWTEFYRPKDFNEVVGVEDLDKIKNLINDSSSMPNVMFYGPAGCGKTTLVKILMNKLKPVDILKVNGSDNTSVDFVRDKIFNFITSMTSNPGKPKIVWIEEFDYFSQSAFACLRSMMEQYVKNARFIVTLNKINKVPEAIQSRFSKYAFKRLTPKSILERLKHVCSKEDITYEEDSLIKLCEKSNGDIRTAINTLQKLTQDKKLESSDVDNFTTTTGEVYKLILEKNWTKIRIEIPNKFPEYNSLLVELDEMFFKSDLSVATKTNINEIISDGLVDLKEIFDENILFSAICSKIIKQL